MLNHAECSRVISGGDPDVEDLVERVRFTTPSIGGARLVAAEALSSAREECAKLAEDFAERIVGWEARATLLAFADTLRSEVS